MPIGDVNPHTSRPHYGNVGMCKDKIVGRRWHNHSVVMRVDLDPTKGPHINVSDCRNGKALGTFIAIPFEGDENTVYAILRRFQRLRYIYE